jgi:KDO2-lipid IV(A) lauroyltransferase
MLTGVGGIAWPAVEIEGLGRAPGSGPAAGGKIERMSFSKYVRVGPSAGSLCVPSFHRLAWRAAAWALSAVWWALGRLSPEHASTLGARVFRTLGPHLYKMPNVRRNLELAFPDRSPAEIEALGRDVWANFGALLAEFAHFDAFCADDGSRRIQVVVSGNSRVLSDRDGQAVFVTAHLANFQLAAFAAGRLLGEPLTVVYAPEKNPWIDRAIAARRERLGCRLVAREGGLRVLMRELEAGRSLGLIVDTRSDPGEMLPFFGIEAETTVVPARLALRYGCELVPVRMERLGPARFRFTLYEPIVPLDPGADDREKARSMMRQVLALFEEWIRERPGEWLCTARRWPREAARLGRGEIHPRASVGLGSLGAR